MRAYACASLVAVVVGVAGCTAALPFGYKFASSVDAGADQAMPTTDFGGADAALPDLAVASDLAHPDSASAPDQLALPHDLAMPDAVMIDLLTLGGVGAPCSNLSDCGLGLTCLTSITYYNAMIQSKIDFPGGYCTRVCEVNSVGVCGEGATCNLLFTGSLSPDGPAMAQSICTASCEATADVCRGSYDCCPVTSKSAGCLPTGAGACQ